MINWLKPHIPLVDARYAVAKGDALIQAHARFVVMPSASLAGADEARHYRVILGRAETWIT